MMQPYIKAKLVITQREQQLYEPVCLLENYIGQSRNGATWSVFAYAVSESSG